MNTKEQFEAINFDELKHTKIIKTDIEDDKILAILEIRGEEYTLLFYDYYMLIAIDLTDNFDDNLVDYEYVCKLRNAIREDVNHFMGAMYDTLASYKNYSLLALDRMIEIYEDYTENGCSCDPEIFDINKKMKPLILLLENVNK